MLFVWIAFPLGPYAPIPIHVPRFFAVWKTAFVLEPNVWIFDPTKRSNSLSTVSLLPDPIPVSNPPHCPRNNGRGSQLLLFPGTVLSGVPASGPIPHRGGSLVHPIGERLVFATTSDTTPLFCVLHRKGHRFSDLLQVCVRHPLRFPVGCPVPKHSRHQFDPVITPVDP